MATSFNGTTSGCLSATLSLSGVSPAMISVSFWMNSSYPATDRYVLNYGSGSAIGFNVSDNNSIHSKPYAQIQSSGGTSASAEITTRPVAGNWHHYVVLFDASSSGAAALNSIWVDSTNQTLTGHLATFTAGSFANFQLSIGQFIGGSSFFTGSLFRVAIFSGALTQAQIQQLFTGTTPTSVASGALYYWTLSNGAASTEANLGSGGSALLTYTNTSNVTDPTPAVASAAPQSWYAGHISGDLTLSGSPLLTATCNSSVAIGGVAATEGISTGKYYCEFTASGTGFTTDISGVGVGSSSARLDVFLGQDNNGIGLFVTSGGDGFYTNTTRVLATPNLTDTAFTAASGLMCMAWDAVNNSLWIRFGTAGNWNGSGTANPVTNSGGAAIGSGITTAPAQYVTTSLAHSGDVITATFAPPFSGTPPSGFGPFDSAATAPLMGAQVL